MIKKERLVNTFLDLVKIDSPSGEEKLISTHVIKILKHLGGVVETDAYGNVIAKFAGKGKPVMLNAHLDTVEPGRGIKPIIEGDKISSDGTTIIGGDSKSGVAAILEALASLHEEKAAHMPIEVVFTLAEEVGLLGAMNLDYSKITSTWGITLDGDNGVNTISTSAPGYSKVDITITGRSAHAGAEPEKGISAIRIASEIIAKLNLGKLDKVSTANIGLIEGGSARNAIPEIAHFKGEIRSLEAKKLEEHTAHFEQTIHETLKKYPEATVDMSIHREFGPYFLQNDHEAIQRVSKVLEQMELEPKLESTLGGSDVNIFHEKGIKVICLGSGDYDAHTTREYVLISEMLDAARFCELLVKSK